MLDTRKMISEVSSEIQRLTKIRDLLTADSTGNGLVPVSTDQPTTAKAPDKAPPKKAVKRVLSPEGKARIAAAVKKRWKLARSQGLSMNGRPLKDKAKKAGNKRGAYKKAASAPVATTA